MNDEQNLKIRQEITKLREQDTNENFFKIKRSNDFRLFKLTEKEKSNQEKMRTMKSQQEIIKKARM